MSEWIVSRSTPWPDGTPTVEIATDVDHLDPSLFWEEKGTAYDDLTARGYEDPREAVRAAIRVRNMWQEKRAKEGLGDEVVIGWANPFYPTSADPKTDEELVSRANELWEAMPVCQHCGVKGVMSEYHDDAWGAFHACDDGCATLFVWSLQEDDTEEAESRVSSEPSFWKWPNVLSDEPVVWYCAEDGSWGGCLAGALLIIPESALTPEESAALDGVTSTRWDEKPGDIIAAAIERNAR